jgi:hypothetical protein
LLLHVAEAEVEKGECSRGIGRVLIFQVFDDDGAQDGLSGTGYKMSVNQF